jgi:hypothetical protein
VEQKINMKNEDLIKSWRIAAQDLNIRIQSPFTLTVGKNKIIATLLVENFGSKKGTIVLSIDYEGDFNEPKKLGYYCSALNPEGYSIYNREKFIDTLNDWGFFGEKKETPDWYTGQTWP